MSSRIGRDDGRCGGNGEVTFFPGVLSKVKGHECAPFTI